MTKNEKHKILFYLNFAEVFFIDDINWVAEVSKPLDAGFMGVPSSMPYNYLREEMIATGVMYRVNRFKDITEKLIHKVDDHLFSTDLWK